LFERLKQEVARSSRHGFPLSLMVFQVGVQGMPSLTVDALTRAAVLMARAMVRDSDIVASLGYGHFGVVANATNDGAGTLAESLARELEAFEFTCGDRPLSVQVRYGLSCLSDGKTPESLLDEARAGLHAGCVGAEWCGLP